MKKIAFFIIAAFAFHSSFAQTEVTTEQGGTKVIRGFMTRDDLKKDSSFSWFAQNGYAPEAGAMQAFRTQKDSINIVVFGGTWCGDTKSLLPKFFSLTDAAGFSADRVTLIGVDRSKKTVHHLAEAFGITNVPTFIVMKNGKEVGRVVEYGKTGMFDKELGEIISKK
jgi:thiol-disulfide isomerase/thioredoxin